MSTLVPTNLAVFDSPPSSIAISEFFDEELSPVNALDMNSSLEFVSPPYSNRMKAIGEMYLYARLQLLKKDLKPYTSEDKIEGKFANNILFSLFKSAKILINNVIVCEIPNCFHYKNFFEAMLNYSSDSLQNQHNLSGVNVPGNTSDDKFYANSRIFDLHGRLNLVPTHKYIIPNVSVTVKLEFNPNSIIINEQTKTIGSETKTSSSTVKIFEIKLYMRQYVLRDSFNIALENSLAKSNAIYNFNCGKIITQTIASNTTSINLPSMYIGLRPKILCFAMVTNNQFIGDYSLDSYLFETYDIKSFNFLINNNSIPKTPYKLNFSNEQKLFARALASVYSSLGIRGENNSIILSRDTYEKLFIIVEDITEGSFGLTDLVSPLEFVNVGVNIEFAKALESPLTLMIYMLTSSQFEINKARNVSVIY